MLIAYAAILALQIALFVFVIRKNTVAYKLALFSAQLLPMAAAWSLAVYYDRLPGSGFMPGFTYFGEALLSYGAAVVYAVFFALSVLVCAVCAIIRHRKARAAR